jgi:hypothetical protein
LIAIAVASLAILIALISLVATGEMAVRLRLVSPRGDALLGEGELIPASISTLGQRVDDLLGPLIEVTVATDDGLAVTRDAYLSADGCILVVSTSCGACRYLMRTARNLLLTKAVRSLVVAPTIARGIEFIERDCGQPGVFYQVDPKGERARALGLSQFPGVLVIADGAIVSAYIIGSRLHLTRVLALGEKNSVGVAPGAFSPHAAATGKADDTSVDI